MTTPTEHAPRQRAGVRRAKRLSSKVDMTPMVDLGFLLITFFVMTAKMSESRTMDLNMPKDSPIHTDVPESGSFTILINDKDELYVYLGKAENITEKSQFVKTTMTGKGGLRNMIQQRQQYLDQSGFQEGRKGLMLIIKPSVNASYKQIVDIMDEALINGVEKHVLVPYGQEDHDLIKQFAN